MRIVALLAVVFLAGVGASALWFRAHKAPETNRTDGGTGVSKPAALSPSTLAVLKRLESPVEIRFYALLDPATTTEAEKAFAGRVDQLLGRYEQAANGMIKATRSATQSDTNAKAAEADGIKAFNNDKGDACFLGIAVSRNGWKESLASLSPEWEGALEMDLTRVIARAAEVPNPRQAAPAPARIDYNAMEAVKQAIPNFDAVSVEQGKQILQEAALNDFARVAQEMEAKVKEAQQSFTQAQANQSEAGQESARQQILQLQYEQTEKLKEVTARFQAQLQALQQLKKK